MTQIELFRRAEGYLESAILFNLFRLAIFDRIGKGEKRVSDLAAELGARPDRLARLLIGGTALGFLESSDGTHFQVNPVYRPFLVRGTSESYVGNWIRYLDRLHEAVFGLDQVILGSNPQIDVLSQEWQCGDERRLLSEAMHNYACGRGRELAQFLDLSRAVSLLDLGCGLGTYSFHLALKYPKLKLYLLDFTEVLEQARRVQRQYSIGNEIHYLAADAVRDPIPGTFDAILISNLLHALGEQVSKELIQRLVYSLNFGGSLIVQAQFLNDNPSAERWPVLLDVIMLAATREGENHSVGQTVRWMEEAGLANVEVCHMSLMNTNSYLRGYKMRGETHEQ